MTAEILRRRVRLMAQLLLVAATLMGSCLQSASGLTVGFYNSVCPGKDVEGTIKSAMQTKFNSDKTIVPGLLRMYFHDSFVQVLLKVLSGIIIKFCRDKYIWTLYILQLWFGYTGIIYDGPQVAKLINLMDWSEVLRNEFENHVGLVNVPGFGCISPDKVHGNQHCRERRRAEPNTPWLWPDWHGQNCSGKDLPWQSLLRRHLSVGHQGCSGSGTNKKKILSTLLGS